LVGWLRRRISSEQRREHHEQQREPDGAVRDGAAFRD
jgi:hypothetical protein